MIADRSINEQVSLFEFTPAGLEFPVSEIDYLARIPSSNYVMLRTKGRLLMLIPENMYCNGGNSVTISGLTKESVLSQEGNPNGVKIYNLDATDPHTISTNIITKLNPELQTARENLLGLIESRSEELDVALTVEAIVNPDAGKPTELSKSLLFNYADIKGAEIMELNGQKVARFKLTDVDHMYVPADAYTFVREGDTRVYIKDWAELVNKRQITFREYTGFPVEEIPTVEQTPVSPKNNMERLGLDPKLIYHYSVMIPVKLGDASQGVKAKVRDNKGNIYLFRFSYSPPLRPGGGTLLTEEYLDTCIVVEEYSDEKMFGKSIES